MKDYSHINKQAFWHNFKEKASKYEPLELKGPLEVNDFYSGIDISDDDVRDILIQSAKELNVRDSQIDAKKLCIHIIHNKYLQLTIEKDFNQPDYFKMGKRKNTSEFQTKIKMDVGETILATKIAVAFMKNMQKNYEDCMFHHFKKSISWRDEIMDITLDPIIFESEKWEHIYNELGVSIHLPKDE
jgi:hypothetical protein